MLHVAYSGTHGEVPRYHCRGAQINHGADWCISFGGLKPDRAVAAEILKAVEGNAIEAALEVAARSAEQQSQRHRGLSLELEQARYEARLAVRRYEAVDPDNRLVAAELEARWNAALRAVGEAEQRLRDNELSDNTARIPDKETLCSLAQDLPAVWNSAMTDMRLKLRIVRILVEEIVADVDDASSEIVLLIHWTGGRQARLLSAKPQQHLPGTAQLDHLGEDQMDSLLHTTIGIDLDFAVLGPSETNGQSELQFPATGFLANGFQRALPQQVQLELAHRSLQGKQEPVIEDARIVNTIWINHDGAHQPTEFDEVVPVSSVSSQAGRLYAEHGANLSRADFRNQMLEPWPLHLAGARAAKILVNDFDLPEAKLASVVGQTILPPLALLVVNHLSR